HPAILELGHRPRRLLTLEHVEAHRHFAGDLHAREADLAVTHRGMHVADGKKPARLPHREVDPGAGTVKVVVEVPAVSVGEARGQVLTGCRDADDTDHRPSWEPNAVVH